MNKRIVRYIIYAVEILLTFVVQVTPYLLPEMFGGKAVLLVTLGISFAVFETEIPAMILAVICGLLTDCSYSGPIGFFVIMLVLVCYFISILYQNYIRRNLLTVMPMSFIMIPLVLILQFVFYYVFAGYTDRMYMFVHHYIPRIIYTVCMMPLAFWVNRFVYRKTKQRKITVRLRKR